MLPNVYPLSSGALERGVISTEIKGVYSKPDTVTGIFSKLKGTKCFFSSLKVLNILVLVKP